MHGLRDLRVVDLSSGIAGGYCTKLYADAGADVIKVETSEGDPLRRWSATDADLGNEDGALFRYLHASKRSLVGAPDDAEVDALIGDADLVVETFAPHAIDPQAFRARHPALVWLSITPWGRTGPWATRPASEFTIQAEAGSIGARGLPGGEPYQAGGRITEWTGGTFASVAALAAVRRARESGAGEHVDFSLLEVMTIAASNFLDLTYRVMGVDSPTGPAQSAETPSIEPTLDGYVGFCTNSQQQFSDFLLLIERPEWRDDKSLRRVAGRVARWDEWNEAVRSFTRRHTTEELIERASLLRIPVAPVNNGDSVRRHEQLVAREAFTTDPSGGFQRPCVPYRIGGTRPGATRRAPRLGEHSGQVEPRDSRRPPARPPRERASADLPLAGLRVLDATAWWAGPSATHMLASLGADVVHVEAVQRIDGMRTTGGNAGRGYDAWWECSTFFLSANTNKRGITLNMSDPDGAALARRLIAQVDAVVENFTPRVFESFGLDWESIHAANPRAFFVRMPAFGLSGPWRDRTGFAQTMEQMTGMAWLTGHADDQPRIQRGPCDPLAGMHAAFALLVALAERDVTGVGQLVEVSMVEGALSAAAEQLVEYTAYGNLMQREGNRAPHAAPQGLYACARSQPGAEHWLALSVTCDAEWRALVGFLGSPDWTRDAALASHAGRRRRHDALDRELRREFEARERDELVAGLLAAGVPAAVVADPRTLSNNPQMQARGFYEEVSHPVVGTHPVPTLPFRYASVDRWTRCPAPTLGQHSREILTDWLGLEDRDLDELERRKIIGVRPDGV